LSDCEDLDLLCTVRQISLGPGDAWVRLCWHRKHSRSLLGVREGDRAAEHNCDEEKMRSRNCQLPTYNTNRVVPAKSLKVSNHSTRYLSARLISLPLPPFLTTHACSVQSSHTLLGSCMRRGTPSPETRRKREQPAAATMRRCFPLRALQCCDPIAGRSFVEATTCHLAPDSYGSLPVSVYRSLR
jgi:hypothetical protein